MIRPGRIIWLVLVFISLFNGIAIAQEDREGCKDHPMFTRMPNYYIDSCREKEFDRADFIDEQGNEIKVEGKIHSTGYAIREGFNSASEFQIVRNYQNAIKRIGGTVVGENDPDEPTKTYLELSKGGKTYWVVVAAYMDGDAYELTVIEKAEMAQVVVADAKSLMSEISATGHASVYGIYFDFDKSDIKPESEPAIREIAKLLRDNEELKLYIVGHTDNVGSLDYNMKLSKARAEAVMKELVKKYQISADRLKAFGVGSLAPVTSNNTEDGRAKNRRVELVEQ